MYDRQLSSSNMVHKNFKFDHGMETRYENGREKLLIVIIQVNIP